MVEEILNESSLVHKSSLQAKEYPGNLRELTAHPFCMVVATYEQLKQTCEKFNSNDETIIHFDSSGKHLSSRYLVLNLGHAIKHIIFIHIILTFRLNKNILVTSACLPPEYDGEGSYDCIDLFSERNRTTDFKIFLGWFSMF